MKKILTIISLFILILAIPGEIRIPVSGANQQDWNADSFWYFPWGKSGVHKGIDIFAKAGTPVLAATSGVVIFKGYIQLGGNTVLMLGPQWRLYYYAHLKDIDTHLFTFKSAGTVIGHVGNTGNAANKPTHLHFSIMRLVPSITNITLEHQGWKRMFYINPHSALEQAS